MQSLQNDLAKRKSPLDVQGKHSTPDSDTRGPVCHFCKKHLLSPTAMICAGCGNVHRANVKRTPKGSVTTTEHCQETNAPSGMDIQNKHFKYSPEFGTQSYARVLSLPAVQTSSQRNQEASSETGDDILNRKRNSSSDGTNEQLIKHIKTDDMSDPTEIDPAGATVSDGKNGSSKSPETEARNISQSSVVGCFVYVCSRDIMFFFYCRLKCKFTKKMILLEI